MKTLRFIAVSIINLSFFFAAPTFAQNNFLPQGEYSIDFHIGSTVMMNAGKITISGTFGDNWSGSTYFNYRGSNACSRSQAAVKQQILKDGNLLITLVRDVANCNKTTLLVKKEGEVWQMSDVNVAADESLSPASQMTGVLKRK